MPEESNNMCFAGLRTSPTHTTPNVVVGRRVFKSVHRTAAVTFSSIFLLILLVCLQEDHYIQVDRWVLFLPSTIILWPSTILWCCGVLGELLDINSESKVLITMCAFPQTMLAISFTLIAFQPELLNGGEDYGTKMVPVFVALGMLGAMGCLMCTFESDAPFVTRVGFCAAMSFAIGVIISIVQICVHIDGGYGEDGGPNWFLIFLPTFIVDIFVVAFIGISIAETCHGQRSLNDTSRTKFSLTALLTVGWLVYFVSRVLFIVREDNMPLYYSLGNIGPLKLRDESMAAPAMVVSLPMLLFGLYLMTIDCTLPCVGGLVDKHLTAKANKANQRIENRRVEREEMERTRNLGHRVFHAGFGDGGEGGGGGGNDGEGTEMVATFAEQKGNDTKDVAPNESQDTNNKHVADSVDIHVMDEDGTDEWKTLLQNLEACETAEACIVVLKQCATLVGQSEELKTHEKKLEIINCAKEKKARQSNIWTSQVAVEFRVVLQQFSLLAAMGIRTNGLRQLSDFVQLKNPFKRSNSAKDEEDITL